MADTKPDEVRCPLCHQDRSALSGACKCGGLDPRSDSRPAVAAAGDSTFVDPALERARADRAARERILDEVDATRAAVLPGVIDKLRNTHDVPTADREATERTMHHAWRKRAEEAEREVDRLKIALAADLRAKAGPAAPVAPSRLSEQEADALLPAPASPGGQPDDEFAERCGVCGKSRGVHSWGAPACPTSAHGFFSTTGNFRPAAPSPAPSVERQALREIIAAYDLWHPTQYFPLRAAIEAARPLAEGQP